jgi:hypothetical protein
MEAIDDRALRNKIAGSVTTDRCGAQISEHTKRSAEWERRGDRPESSRRETRREHQVSKTKARGDQQRDLPINRQTSTTAEPSAPQGLKLISLIVVQLLSVTSVSGTTSSPTRRPNRIRSMVRLISMQWLAEIARDGMG